MKARNPFIFVAGCPRSGTTLLQRMLDSHPMLAVANDTHFIPRVVGKEFAGQNDIPLTPELVEKTFQYHRFYRLGLSRETVISASQGVQGYSEFVSRLYDAFGKQQEKPLAGEKTPDYGRFLPELLTLFPWSRAIHIIRDGRDVCLSTLQWAIKRHRKGPAKWGFWDIDPVATCAFWWTWQVAPALEAEAALGPGKVLQVRYEALVSDPKNELERISEFLSIPYSERMMDFHVGREKITDRGSAKSQWKPATKGLRDWRKEMNPDDQAVFGALAGDLLETVGYGQGPEGSSGKSLERIRQARAWWEASHNGKRRRHTNQG